MDYLKKNKLDGLFNTDNKCDCTMDMNGVIPCKQIKMDCISGINIPVSKNSVDTFQIIPKNNALSNWPECPKCKESNNIPEHKKSDINSCENCRNTGKIIRYKKDYETLGDLFYTRSYNKLLSKAQ